MIQIQKFAYETAADGGELLDLNVREMKPDEIGVLIDYFHDATPEHLEMLGVDPKRLPPPKKWRAHHEAENSKPLESRGSMQLLWELDGAPVGCSTTDRIIVGKEAFMHLHILEPDRRRSGIGAECVKRSAQLYFERLRLERLFCEPNAFNTAPCSAPGSNM